MDNEQLHPNLARIAATYDDLFEQYSRNQLSAAEAKARIRTLVARDDHGIEWSLNPEDRSWYRRTVHGQWIKDTPPTVGVATWNGWDISGHDPMSDPRYRVEETPTDPRLITNTDALRGSTARMVRNHPDPDPVPRSTERSRWILTGVLVAITVVVTVWFFTAWNSPLRENPTPVAPAPAAPLPS
jgi:hypothetical protein